jgi:predicted O-methyltransferase YrrM
MTIPRMHNLRRRTAHAFVRRPMLRRVMSLGYHAQAWTRPYDLSHLSVFGEPGDIGPIQRDEALLLYALTRVLRPRVIVEIGFLYGRSALNFLQAMPKGARLHSFDISEEAEEIARTLFAGAPNFTFHRTSQTDIEPAHVGGEPVDLVFLDAAHDLELNQRTWERLQKMLGARATIVVHDTGTWSREHMFGQHAAYAATAGTEVEWLSDHEYQQQREERLFVNWILETHPDFGMVHLHTTDTLRHGLTLVQRRDPLLVDRPSA